MVVKAVTHNGWSQEKRRQQAFRRGVGEHAYRLDPDRAQGIGEQPPEQRQRRVEARRISDGNRESAVIGSRNSHAVVAARRMQ